MCCFAGPVRSVTSTRIFGRLTGVGTQFIAYQMKYRSDALNAMILPLPTVKKPGEDAVRFVDLSGYDRFFADLDRGFMHRPKSRSLFLPAINSAIDRPLKVHKVGNFDASFVPTMKDFDRLDPRFTISKDVWAQLPEYQDWGFAVFQLHELAGEPHAMAFEFQTRQKETVFFPTVHIHDGKVHGEEEFDHTLYTQHAGLDAIAGEASFRPDPGTKMMRSTGPASKFVKTEKTQGLVDGDLLVHRRQMKGTFTNNDVWISTHPATNATRSRGQKYGAIKTLAPLGMLVPLTWIVSRRNHLRNK